MTWSTMLEGLKRQGVIDPAGFGDIEEGDERYQEIQDAMNECDLAILLVSQNFIASRFIQDEELPRLLKRRSELGLRVVPIIVRPCKWTSETISSANFQALPKDGKPVITFSKDNGERDQVWVDIASVIEKRAKAALDLKRPEGSKTFGTFLYFLLFSSSQLLISPLLHRRSPGFYSCIAVGCNF